MATATYPPDFHPDAIDTRLVLRIYTWIAFPLGLIVGFAPRLIPGLAANPDLPDIPWGRTAFVRLAAAVVVALADSALGMSLIENPVSRRRALRWFAIGHVYLGSVFASQSYSVFPRFIPRAFWDLPLIVGIVLLFIALTSAHAPRVARSFWFFSEPEQGPVPVIRDRARRAVDSQYEDHIRRAARMEERTRLARDLHDAVKQQLFVIQTSAATVQERFDTDAPGARSALEQVRAAARDALTEMRALIEQLQASPLENTGLVTALQEQCDALGLRTGAEVHVEIGTLPPSHALLPGTQEALFRAAQEALSNIARHARATTVHVRLGMTRDRLELTIRDNGVGFDPEQLQRGMGLNNMNARLSEVSGSMILSPQPHGGTLVAFSVPCDTRRADDYLMRALLWFGVFALMAFTLTFGSSWEKPWTAAIAAITAITVARHAVAFYRVRMRERAETPA